jgi:TatD DNase family protein
MIDTHCHIDAEEFAADRDELLQCQQAEGVQTIIVPGVSLASVQTVMAVCTQYPSFCYPALGLHPEEIKADWQQQINEIETHIRHYAPQLVAVGEIGLDYYWDKTYKQEQQQALRQQLLLAKELNLPVILHNRESTEDIIRIVREVQADTTSPHPLRGVFHCFTGSKETAQQIIEMGFYLGIGGVITFKNCKLSDNLVDVPMERILLETDAPYMAPVPHRGKRNESRWMSFVANKLAEVYSTTPTTIIEATTRNACTLFGLKCAKN